MATDNLNNDSLEVSKKDRMLILTLICVVLVIAALAVCGFLFMKQGPDTVQGQGDATEVRISGKLPGRVVEIFVEEGQHVKEGDTLVHIHSSLVDAKLSQAKAMETVASAADHKVDAGTRSQIVAAAKDLWTQAQAASGITEKTYRRLENLYNQGVVSEQKRDEAKAAYDAAKAAESAARSQYELALAGVNL
ncbi:MAG: biotin/lipoyl-binding protein, partial [Muribaculaceae bacterium]|nr:biotin/lipoyl-binding protein [Muribaculaceae bacterium]